MDATRWNLMAPFPKASCVTPGLLRSLVVMNLSDLPKLHCGRLLLLSGWAPHAEGIGYAPGATRGGVWLTNCLVFVFGRIEYRGPSSQKPSTSYFMGPGEHAPRRYPSNPGAFLGASRFSVPIETSGGLRYLVALSSQVPMIRSPEGSGYCGSLLSLRPPTCRLLPGPVPIFHLAPVFNALGRYIGPGEERPTANPAVFLAWSRVSVPRPHEGALRFTLSA